MRFSSTRLSAVGLAIAAATTFAAQSSVVGVPAATSSAARTWAPAASAAITPGVQMYTQGAQCTANFVFTDAAGTVYVGYAAHCAGTGAATDTNGCNTKSLPLGTNVKFARGGSLASGGEQVGTGELAYSSWLAMQDSGDHNAHSCAYNDLALVKVDPAFVNDVNPTVPFWGGPVGLHANGAALGDRVYSYGNSSLRGGVEALSPKTGLSIGDEGNHWSHNVYTVTPGIPGDSGSGFMDANGRALGVLSTVQLAPLVGANGVGDLANEVAYAGNHGVSGLRVVSGTEPFAPLV
jgi:hypothetical protein